MFLRIPGSPQRSVFELAELCLRSDDVAKESSESLFPAELSILALPIRLGDVG
jgi:hypothetical protein